MCVTVSMPVAYSTFNITLYRSKCQLLNCFVRPEKIKAANFPRYKGKIYKLTGCVNEKPSVTVPVTNELRIAVYSLAYLIFYFL